MGSWRRWVNLLSNASNSAPPPAGIPLGVGHGTTAREAPSTVRIECGTSEPQGERATRTERAVEAARERACRGSPRGDAPRRWIGVGHGTTAREAPSTVRISAERANRKVSEPRERSAPSKRRARERVGEHREARPLKGDGDDGHEIHETMEARGWWSVRVVDAGVRLRLQHRTAGNDRPGAATAGQPGRARR